MYSSNNLFLKHECERLGVPVRDSLIVETYGQNNEGIIVEAALKPIMNLAGRNMAEVRYIEIGANHPVHNSATYLLYRKYGARGVLVEPLADLCETLETARPGDKVINAAISNRSDPTLRFYRARWDALSTLQYDFPRANWASRRSPSTISTSTISWFGLLESALISYRSILRATTPT